nr:putative ribonuclease H-like domain-containing protein [Tanacetum cinerariifolium]
MTGNISYLFEYEPYDGGYVSFGQGGGKITGKDSDYGGATQDRKSTTRGCQFLVRRLISWQSKKQTIVATSTTEAEYVAAASSYDNVADLLTKPFDVGRFQYLVGAGSAILTEPHHTPSPQEQYSPHHDPSSPSHPTTTTEPIPQTPNETPTETPTLRDDSQGEAFPTVSCLDAGQDRENNNKTSALPHESSPMVTSFDADEGTQDLEISGLNARVKFLEDKDKGSAEPSQEDAPIKGGSMEIREEVRVERSTELGSNDTEEMVNLLSSMEAANILTIGVAAVSVSPVAAATIAGVPTVSGLFPTVSAIFTTASVVTPYSRRPREISAKDKGKEKVVESEVPKKRKLQEQIDAQVAREMKEESTREN